MPGSPGHDLGLAIGIIGGLFVFEFLIVVVRAFRRDSREGPVLGSIQEFEWRSEWRLESTYRDNLLRHLHERLAPRQKPEEPLRTGTKVDLTIRLRRSEFFITIKRGIDNQTRLTLQGEIEDIVTECRARRGKDATVVVVVGFPPGEDQAKLESHVQALEEHLKARRASLELDKHGRDEISSRVVDRA